LGRHWYEEQETKRKLEVNPYRFSRRRRAGKEGRCWWNVRRCSGWLKIIAMKNFYLFPILIVSATLGCLDYIIYIYQTD
jgi:hypothetical protein